MRVDTEDGGHRFAACVGSYGYMGDLMALSERMRWLGPARYGLAGAATLLRGRAYGAAVSLLPAAPARCVTLPRLGLGSRVDFRVLRVRAGRRASHQAVCCEAV